MRSMERWVGECLVVVLYRAALICGLARVGTWVKEGKGPAWEGLLRGCCVFFLEPYYPVKKFAFPIAL